MGWWSADLCFSVPVVFYRPGWSGWKVSEDNVEVAEGIMRVEASQRCRGLTYSYLSPGETRAEGVVV